MRITVRRVLELIAGLPKREDILRDYPYLEDEDLTQALRVAGAAVSGHESSLGRVA
jgi:uncharacterized protein (DUF433 family)